MNSPRQLAIVGCGKVGTCLGVLLSRKGWKVTALFDHTPGNARKAARLIRGARCLTRLAELPAGAGVVALTVPDDEILGCARSVARQVRPAPGTTVMHLSGAKGVSVLWPIKRPGVHRAALHPIQTFSSVSQAVRALPGSYFEVTGDRGGVAAARQMVKDLNGKLLVVKEADRVISHIASVISCNYQSSLLAAMITCYRKIGIGQEAALKIQKPLVETTLQNNLQQGPARSLTGPIARGDTATVELHLTTLKRCLKGLLPLYCELGRATVTLALEKGTLSHPKARLLLRLFSRYSR